jgi:iron(III) transport system substrate-binding protein
MSRHWRIPAIIAATLLAATAFACSSESSNDTTTTTPPPEPTGEETITVYSGRSEELVGPLMDLFTEETGIAVNVRYGDTAELAAQILEEGENSPADVFFAQDAGALGAVSAAGLFRPLDAAQLDAVPEGFRATNGTWVGVSGRARVVVYNTNNVDPDEVPDTLDGLTRPEWANRIGWAPTNGSFQSFVTALRLLEGDEAAGEWLEAMDANGAQAYEKNGAILEAVATGEVDLGLVNHYYLYPYLTENPDAPIANAYIDAGGAGALVNLAGVGILASSAQPGAASAFVSFLLSDIAQEYFATETFEYPLVAGVDAAPELPNLAEIQTPALDLTQLEDLNGTLELLRERGVV